MRGFSVAQYVSFKAKMHHFANIIGVDLKANFGPNKREIFLFKNDVLSISAFSHLDLDYFLRSHFLGSCSRNIKFTFRLKIVSRHCGCHFFGSHSIFYQM